MSQRHPLETRLGEAWPPGDWRDVTVLLAVSGGADSVALLRAVAALAAGGRAAGSAGRLCVAHFNHGLRGEESRADEAFVVGLCGELGLTCEVGRAAPGALDGGDGLEAAARDARYRFLAEAAANLGARYVATAHTSDDQAETILHRILRGTGIGGLAGIARARPLSLPLSTSGGFPEADSPAAATLIRPLLGFRRRELVGYLDDLGQTYRTDSSNAHPHFTRNRIRRELLPTLAEQYNSGVVDALLRLGTLAGEAQAVIDAVVDALFDRSVTFGNSDDVEIDARSLLGQPPYVVRELLLRVWRRAGWPMQSMGFAQWDQLAEMLVAGGRADGSSISGATFPGSVQAEAVAGGLRLTRTTH